MRSSIGNMRREAGMTIVELLIAGFILSIVLGMVAVFLSQQSTLNQRTQARGEVQDKVRMVMQMVTADLQLAGAKVYADPSGTLQSISPNLNNCPVASGVNTCLEGEASGGGSAGQDVLAMAYVTTLRAPSAACREVGYRFDGASLLRADRLCTGSHVDTSSSTGFDTVGTNVLALDVSYLCSNGNVLGSVPDAANCPSGTSYVRSAIVSVVAASDARVPNQGVQTFTLGSGAQVTCGPNRYCVELTQEVLMPNLKDR